MVKSGQTAVHKESAKVDVASEAESAADGTDVGGLKGPPKFSVGAAWRPPVRPCVADFGADDGVAECDDGADGKAEVRAAEAAEKEGALLDFADDRLRVCLPAKVRRVVHAEIFVPVNNFDFLVVESEFGECRWWACILGFVKVNNVSFVK